jgi:hypothetical protein
MTKQEYLVLIQIGGAGDPEIWRAGAGVWLTDEQAAVHLAAGNIQAINKTVVPEAPASDVVVHEVGEKPAEVKKVK